MKDKLLGIVGMGVIALAVMMMFGAAWLAYVPVTVLTPQVQPYLVLTPSVKSGDTLVYQVNACKYREATGVITRSFVDDSGTAYPLASVQGNVRKGCQKTNVPVIVPVLHPGVWHVTLDVGYRVNPIRTEYYHLSTETFNITGEVKL